MPIPAAPDGPLTPGAATLKLFQQTHDQVRDELHGVTNECLNYTPAPGTNSIAVIIRHLIGSETETLRAVAGTTIERDRDAEFVPRAVTVAEVLGLLVDADNLIRELAPLIDDERLVAGVALPTLPVEEVRPGLTWLIGSYGHAREHVGHVQLTKQLFFSAIRGS